MRRQGRSSVQTYYNDTELLIHAVSQQQGCSRQWRGPNQICSVAAALYWEEYPLRYVLEIQYKEAAVVFLM